MLRCWVTSSARLCHLCLPVVSPSLWGFRQVNRAHYHAPSRLCFPSFALGQVFLWRWQDSSYHFHPHGSKSMEDVTLPDSCSKTPGPQLSHIPTLNQCLYVPGAHKPGGDTDTPRIVGVVTSTQTTWTERERGGFSRKMGKCFLRTGEKERGISKFICMHFRAFHAK